MDCHLQPVLGAIVNYWDRRSLWQVLDAAVRNC
jgi:hypothetical protein